MSVSTFDDFCTALCDLIGIAPPEFDQGDDGERGFTLTLDGVLVGFTEGTSADQPGLVMSVMFDPPPPNKLADVLAALMQANFELASVDAPSFALDPDTGEIWLRKSMLLAHVDVRTVYAGLVNASQAARDWRETYFLEPPRRESAVDMQMLGFA